MPGRRGADVRDWRRRGGTVVPPRPVDPEQLASVHASEYLTFIASTAGRAAAGPRDRPMDGGAPGGGRPRNPSPYPLLPADARGRRPGFPTGGGPNQIGGRAGPS